MTFKLPDDATLDKLLSQIPDKAIKKISKQYDTDVKPCRDHHELYSQTEHKKTIFSKEEWACFLINGRKSVLFMTQYMTTSTAHWGM